MSNYCHAIQPDHDRRCLRLDSHIGDHGNGSHRWPSLGEDSESMLRLLMLPVATEWAVRRFAPDATHPKEEFQCSISNDYSWVKGSFETLNEAINAAIEEHTLNEPRKESK